MKLRMLLGDLLCELWRFHPQAKQDADAFGLVHEVDSLVRRAFGQCNAHNFERHSAKLGPLYYQCKHHLETLSFLENASVLFDLIVDKKHSERIHPILHQL